MTEYAWSELRDRAIGYFRETPGAELEQRIIDIFHQHPQAVAALIDTIKAKFDAGKVQSGWALLQYEAQRIESIGDHRATDTTDRNRALKNVEQRMRTEFLHYDRDTEVHDELFGGRGMLRHWPELATKSRADWIQARPAGERIEEEELERAAQYRQYSGVFPTPEPEAPPEPPVAVAAAPPNPLLDDHPL